MAGEKSYRNLAVVRKNLSEVSQVRSKSSRLAGGMSGRIHGLIIQDFHVFHSFLCYSSIMCLLSV